MNRPATLSATIPPSSEASEPRTTAITGVTFDESESIKAFEADLVQDFAAEIITSTKDANFLLAVIDLSEATDLAETRNARHEIVQYLSQSDIQAQFGNLTRNPVFFQALKAEAHTAEQRLAELDTAAAKRRRKKVRRIVAGTVIFVSTATASVKGLGGPKNTAAMVEVIPDPRAQNPAAAAPKQSKAETDETATVHEITAAEAAEAANDRIFAYSNKTESIQAQLFLAAEAERTKHFAAIERRVERLQNRFSKLLAEQQKIKNWPESKSNKRDFEMRIAGMIGKQGRLLQAEKYNLQQVFSAEAWQKNMEIAFAEAERCDLDPFLVASVIIQESRFARNAESNQGARGIMQINQITEKEIKRLNLLVGYKTDFRDPTTNIHGGVAYLAKLVDDNHGNLAAALAGYNAGPTSLTKIQGGKKDLPTETMRYVASILANMENLRDGNPWQDFGSVARAKLETIVLDAIAEHRNLQLTKFLAKVRSIVAQALAKGSAKAA